MIFKYRPTAVRLIKRVVKISFHFHRMSRTLKVVTLIVPGDFGGYDRINAMFPAGQQVKNCCPPRPLICTIRLDITHL
jgi:hypothetical protein